MFIEIASVIPNQLYKKNEEGKEVKKKKTEVVKCQGKWRNETVGKWTKILIQYLNSRIKKQRLRVSQPLPNPILLSRGSLALLYLKEKKSPTANIAVNLLSFFKRRSFCRYLSEFSQIILLESTLIMILRTKVETRWEHTKVLTMKRIVENVIETC